MSFFFRPQAPTFSYQQQKTDVICKRGENILFTGTQDVKTHERLKRRPRVNQRGIENRKKNPINKFNEFGSLPAQRNFGNPVPQPPGISMRSLQNFINR